MNIRRITTSALPLLVASSSALADPVNNTKPGAAAPETQIEEPAQMQPGAPSPTPPRTAPPPPPSAPPPPSPPVGTTQTTAYDSRTGGPVMLVEAAPPPRSRVEDRWSTEPLIGFGSNDYNFGFGGRVGYTFKVPVYVGGTVMWHYGETRDFVGLNGTTETRNTFSYPAGEVGYDIGIGHNAPVVVRPYAGAGVLLKYRSTLQNNLFFTSDADFEFLLYPGVTAHYNIPRSPAYLGVDTRLLVPVASADLSYQAFGVIGASL